jgi:hypothetical protein
MAVPYNYHEVVYVFVSPMLLQRVEQPFDDESYITELKLDGIRLILSKFDKKVRIYTRHNNEVTAKFPELLTIDIPDGTVLSRPTTKKDNKNKPSNIIDISIMFKDLILKITLNINTYGIISKFAIRG